MEEYGDVELRPWMSELSDEFDQWVEEMGLIGKDHISKVEHSNRIKIMGHNVTPVSHYPVGQDQVLTFDPQ